LKRNIAERNPGSSDFSGDDTSASTKSFDQTTINRKVSSVVLRGSRRIRTEHGPEVNAPDDACAVLAPASAAKAFMVVIDKDWYDGCEPLDERKAWPDWEKAAGLMACCGVKELARSAAEVYEICEFVDVVLALDGY
jgi:hypothetical protein